MERDDIIKIAEAIAQQYNPEGLRPFPYELIVKDKNDLGIYLVELAKEVSGAIAYNKEQKSFEIFINESKPRTRQHFTIAHELGHYFLHKEYIQEEETLVDGENYLDGNPTLFRSENQQSNISDRQANIFAASLIMPEGLVRKAWNALRSIEECAKVFNVSTTAMSIRLERLGLLPA